MERYDKICQCEHSQRSKVNIRYNVKKVKPEGQGATHCSSSYSWGVLEQGTRPPSTNWLLSGRAQLHTQVTSLTITSINEWMKTVRLQWEQTQQVATRSRLRWLCTVTLTHCWNKRALIWFKCIYNMLHTATSWRLKVLLQKADAWKSQLEEKEDLEERKV